MSKTYDIAVVGATGVVGESMLEILSERKFPVGKIYALASERSIGKTVSFGHRELEVENLADFDFSTVQIGLFSAGGSMKVPVNLLLAQPTVDLSKNRPRWAARPSRRGCATP